MIHPLFLRPPSPPFLFPLLIHPLFFLSLFFFTLTCNGSSCFLHFFPLILVSFCFPFFYITHDSSFFVAIDSYFVVSLFSFLLLTHSPSSSFTLFSLILVPFFFLHFIFFSPLIHDMHFLVTFDAHGVQLLLFSVALNSWSLLFFILLFFLFFFNFRSLFFSFILLFFFNP